MLKPTDRITIDLPWPPSLNHIWRNSGKRVYRGPKYIQWITQAGWAIKAQKPLKIEGGFAAIIILNPPDKRQIDADNRVKVVLDIAQKMGLVENDSFCRLHLVVYGVRELLPVGVRLILIPVDESLIVDDIAVLPAIIQHLVLESP